ncbi:Tether containing UBX domain for GLUT4 [Halotydeus destructor]|nr:Tether containing UBX domain for GLUT4 [Halotydeus destructor]
MSVTVVCPGARRLPLKVTPNTTMLQILEQACQAQTLNQADYSLCHMNKPLDLSLTVRFAMLPNNAQLEMKKGSSARQESNVTIALQFESGARKMADFSPATSLFEIISILNEGDLVIKPKQEIVAVYMQKETVGQEALLETTLRTLGLTSGRAAIRVCCRDASSIGGQAHVEDLRIKKKPNAESVSSKAVSGMKKAIHTVSDAVSSSSSGSSGSKGSKKSEPSKSKSKPQNAAQNALQQAKNLFTKKQEPQGHRLGGASDEAHAAILRQTGQVNSEPMAEEKEAEPAAEAVEIQPAVSEPELTDEQIGINWLGERNALIFKIDDIPKMNSSQESDDFFELTREDVVFMLDDLKKQMSAINERPLETKSMREAKESRQAERYKKAVLRINFPSDGLVLQATFEPTETVQTVIDFVRQYIEDTELGFYIYVAPPKQVLKPADTLVSCSLVPAAMVHVGHLTNSPILKAEVKAKTTMFSAITKATTKLRKQLHGIEAKEIFVPSASGSNESESLPSTSHETHPTRPAAEEFRKSSAAPETSGKVPKWFKFGK